MEFCPEIAVFQSALQLIRKQTNEQLPALSKDASGLFMNVIHTAVDEICHGLEQDSTEADSEAWNQKLHLICFYSVIDNFYREPVEKTTGRVPVCGTLDMIVGMIPKFSPQFYFEMLKTCSWTHHFIQCLEYIDRDTASSILNDILEHSKCDPVASGDTEVIAMVADKILSSCLFLPITMDTTVLALLKPITKQRRYVQIVYPDLEQDKVKEDHVNERQKMKKSTSKTENLTDLRYIGDTFWDYFVDKNSYVIGYVLDYLEQCINTAEKDEGTGQSRVEVAKETDEEIRIGHNKSDILDDVAKVFLLWYIHTLGQDGQDSAILGSWFVKNFFKLNRSGTNSVNPLAERSVLHYRLNMCLVGKIGNEEVRKRLIKLVLRSSDILHHCLGGNHKNIDSTGTLCMEGNSPGISSVEEQRSRSDETHPRSEGMSSRSDVEESKFSFKEDTSVLRLREESLCVKTLVLLRMVQKTFIMECEGEEMDILTSLVYNEGSLVQNGCLILGDDWWRDVTMDALLWRIEHKLYMYEDCLQTLLSETCWSFWKSERVYDVLNQSPGLLCKKSVVLGCIEIMTYLLQQKQQQLTWSADPRMRDLLCTSFSHMTGIEKDAVIAEMYLDESKDMAQILGDSQSGLQITNTFNKVSAEMDDQVLNEILLLFLKDPVSVCEAILEMCVKNEDQAVNSAKILCKMPVTCRTKHPVTHPGTSLIVVVVDSFIRENKMADKEEKHFISFVKRLMKPHKKDNSTCILPPFDLITTSLLEPVDVNNFLLGSHPVKCSFALSLLVAALECSCNINCDWSGSNFEPVVLMVNLVGILHECIAFWVEESGDVDVTSSEGQLESVVTMVTGHQKIVMKEKLLACLELLVNLMLDGFIPKPDNESIYWLLGVIEDLNWIVKVTVAKYLYKLGHIQPMSDWLVNFRALTENMTGNLPAILMFGIIDTAFMEEMDDVERQTDVSYDDLIAALVQTIPNLLIEEIPLVVGMIEVLIHKDMLSIYYRSTSQTALLLTDLTAIKPILYVSQILRDVIMTLNFIQGERSSMLKHVMQCYISVMKVKCSQSFETVELQLFTLSQVFQHMCGLIECLPQDCADNGLVLLLHLLTKFKDISTETTLSDEKRSQLSKEKKLGGKKVGKKFSPKFVKNLENVMTISVESLSDNFEEKLMLLKKLAGPDL